MQFGKVNSLVGRLLQKCVKNRPLSISNHLGIAPLSSIRTYETLAVTTPAPNVFHVELNRPEKRNSFNVPMWHEIGQCFDTLNNDATCRVIILSGAGQMFTAGIDFGGLGGMMEIIASEQDVARKCKQFYAEITTYQKSFTSLEKCLKPVIAAVHSACIGAGVDLICGADIRYCSADAWFQIKEVEVGLAADVGTLQRLPHIIGNQSLVRELAFSARQMFSDEALQHGLVSRVFPNKAGMLDAAIRMASTIASKSPVAVQGTKRHLLYSRDHSVEDSLEYQAIWNQTMLQSEDLVNSAKAMFSKTDPKFSDY